MEPIQEPSRPATADQKLITVVTQTLQLLVYANYKFMAMIIALGWIAQTESSAEFRKNIFSCQVLGVPCFACSIILAKTVESQLRRRRWRLWTNRALVVSSVLFATVGFGSFIACFAIGVVQMHAAGFSCGRGGSLLGCALFGAAVSMVVFLALMMLLYLYNVVLGLLQAWNGVFFIAGVGAQDGRRILQGRVDYKWEPIEEPEPSRPASAANEETIQAAYRAMHDLTTLNYIFMAAVVVAMAMGYPAITSPGCPEEVLSLYENCGFLAPISILCSFMYAMMVKLQLDRAVFFMRGGSMTQHRSSFLEDSKLCGFICVAVSVTCAVAAAGLLVYGFFNFIKMNAVELGRHGGSFSGLAAPALMGAAAVLMVVFLVVALVSYLRSVVSNLRPAVEEFLSGDRSWRTTW